MYRAHAGAAMTVQLCRDGGSIPDAGCASARQTDDGVPSAKRLVASGRFCHTAAPVDVQTAVAKNFIDFILFFLGVQGYWLARRPVGMPVANTSEGLNLIDLSRTFLPGEFRYVGTRMRNFGPWNIPIAARSRSALADHFGGVCFRLGEWEAEDVIVVDKDPLRLVYVRPAFHDYRDAALRVFPPAPWSVVIDHCLGRMIAEKAGYGYVLVQRITRRVNSSHAYLERTTFKGRPTYDWKGAPDLCFSDGRIANKALHRGIYFWGRGRYQPYDPAVPSDAGLTLKQHGRWWWALGVEDRHEPCGHLKPLESDRTT